MTMRCWHRPGPPRGAWVKCRHCGVAIEECPCVKLHRAPDPNCRACDGSMWVSIVRSERQKFAEYVGEEAR